MDKNKNPVQQKFFAWIHQVIPPSATLVDEVSDILGIGIDSAYRRIRGDSTLSLDEAAKICEHFNVSFDSMLEFRAGTVNFGYNPVKSFDNCKNYFDRIIEELEKVNKIGSKQNIYAADDLPLFYNFGDRFLSDFKIYYWMRSIINLPEFEGKKYDTSMITDELREHARKIHDLYASLSTIEIWTEDTPVSLIKQIGFYWESGIFNNIDEALLICEDLKKVLKRIEKQAETGSKINSQGIQITPQYSYQLYASDIEIGINSILVDAGPNKIVYLSFNPFNILTTFNVGFCNETEKWLANLIKKSYLISGTAEKQRFRFFSGIYERLDALINRIEKKNVY